MSELKTLHEATVFLLEGGISLKGDLLFSTVSSVFAEGCKLIKNHKSSAVDIDMSNIEKIDSAGIALLLDWKRLCDAHNKKYQLKNLSQQALSLISTNKLEPLLNVN